MSVWTGATDELRQYLAQRELQQRQDLLDQIAERERQRKFQFDTEAEARAKQEMALRLKQEERLAADRDEDRKNLERERAYRRGSNLAQFMPEGEVSPEAAKALDEAGFGGLVKKSPGVALPLARPTPTTKPGDIPLLPVAPSMQQITPDKLTTAGGTRIQEQRAQAQARADAQAQSERAAMERTQENIASREAEGERNRQLRAAIGAMARGQGGLTPYQRVQYANSLRDDFTRESKDFATVAKSARELESTLGRNDAAGDVAAIFQFMRALDPTSVVRETEQATAQNARGVPESVRTYWNRMISGERLGPQQRKEFMGVVRGIYQSGLANQERRIKEYTEDAVAAGVDPRRVIRDYTNEPANEQTPAPTPTAAAAAAPGAAPPKSKYKVLSVTPGK